MKIIIRLISKLSYLSYLRKIPERPCHCCKTGILKIKVALAHPALVVMAIKNRVFSFADMLLFLPCFPDFQHSF